MFSSSRVPGVRLCAGGPAEGGRRGRERDSKLVCDALLTKSLPLGDTDLRREDKDKDKEGRIEIRIRVRRIGYDRIRIEGRIRMIGYK